MNQLQAAFAKGLGAFTLMGVIIAMAMLAFVSACDSDPSMEMGAETDRIQKEEITAAEMTSAHARMTDFGPVSSTDDPMRDAFGLLQLDVDRLSRPPAHELGYIMLARWPLVDDLSQSPFFLQRWAHNMSHALQAENSRSLEKTFFIVADTLAGDQREYSANENRSGDERGILAAYRHLCHAFGWTPNASDLHALEQIGFSARFDRQLGLLMYRLTDAAIWADRAYADLSPAEQELLTASPERYFFRSDLQFSFLTAPTDGQVEMVKAARNIKFDALLEAFAILARALDDFKQFLDQGARVLPAEETYFKDAAIRAGTLMNLPSPVGPIVILGQDDNTFTGNAALLIDLGGHDRYSGAAPVTASVNRRISILVDIDGNDHYGDGGGKMSQGAGIASIGLLADFGGDDRYVAGDMAQGCGMFGIGALLDTVGNDVYEMGLMGQGFGVFGIGLLADRSGNDRFTMAGMGQGVGSTLGFGILLDGDGDDYYRADPALGKSSLRPDNWSHAQGAGLSVRSPAWHRHFSLYGGIGLLSEGSGDDAYHCAGGNCMGSAYFMSVGALVDHAGNDRYFPKSGNGMGFAVHLANGVLIDKEGDDLYIAKMDSGGVGADHSVGILADYQGDDVYGPSPISGSDEMTALNAKDASAGAISPMVLPGDLAVSSYGSASRSKGLGFLVDYGGNDRYFARIGTESDSCGAVIPPTDPHEWSHAVLIDLGGSDVHNSADRKNNTYRIDLSHGLFYDIDLQPGITGVPAAAPVTSTGSQSDKWVPITSFPPVLMDEAALLAGHHNFKRFGSIGRIVQSPPDVIDALIDTLRTSHDKNVNLALIEALHHYILRKEMTPERTRRFETLLRAEEADVRIFAARTLGWWQVGSAAPAVVSAVKDPDPEVRRHVIWALGELGRIEHLKVLREAASAEASMLCKQSAIRAFRTLLAKYPDVAANFRREIQAAVLAWLSDPDPIIRREAAWAMRFIKPQSDGLHALTARLEDADIYVKRAAALSLAHLGNKEGIAVLIDSLTFPSIDTRDHYDRDLIKELAFFCGIDFAEESRYDPQVWKEWWQKNAERVNIMENLVIMNTIEDAFATDSEADGLNILERLRAQYPENAVIKSRMIRFCKDWITYRLLAQQSIDRRVIERCVRLQQTVVALEPDRAQHHATLAGYYARLGMFDDARAAINSAIRLEPANSRYHIMHDQYASMGKTAPLEFGASGKTIIDRVD